MQKKIYILLFRYKTKFSQLKYDHNVIISNNTHCSFFVNIYRYKNKTNFPRNKPELVKFPPHSITQTTNLLRENFMLSRL